MQPEYAPTPGAVAEPTAYVAPPPDPNAKPSEPGVVWAADGTVKPPQINVLVDRFKGEAVTPAPPPTPGPAPVVPVGVTLPVKKSRKPAAVAMIVGAVVVLAGGAGAYVYLQPKPAKVAVVATPTPSPSATPTPSPTPSPTPTPSATPAPTPTPDLALTAPTVAPTNDHPQSSVVKSPSGLWLRSSPSSANKSNIIGWMPKGSTVSVDSVGDFWWHGVYKGQPGYFASKYTN